MPIALVIRIIKPPIAFLQSAVLYLNSLSKTYLTTEAKVPFNDIADELKLITASIA